ncbi:MAG: PKD domain-containing protein [Tepidisphaeraceae bacterium]
MITLTSPATVYPLESVNVQALNSSFGSGTLLNSKITWNFGDPGSAYNDSLVGFNAAHAYANPGTYTITMSITTPDGHVGVATQTVTIAQDNRPTIYVAADGNDANDGSSPNDPIQSLARLGQLLTSNVRVLFHDGDTFTLSNTSAIDLGGLQHVYIGSYGSGAQPVLYYNGAAHGGSFIGMSNSTSGIVVQGLTFNSIFLNNDNKQAIPLGFLPTGNDITILDNTFLNLGDDVNLQLDPSNVLIQDNTSPDPTALSGYFGWVAGTEINFLGNTVASSTGEAVMRVAGVTDLELAYNNFTNNPETPGGLAISKNNLSTQVGQYVYVYHNSFTAGAANAGPLGTDVANPNVTISDVVFDSNTVNRTTILLTPGVFDVMVENNVIHGNNGAGITIDAQEIGGGFNWTTNNVWIEHNTVTEPGQYGGFLYVNDGEAADVYVDYNLFVDPNYQVGSGQAFISVDENDMNSFAQIKDNVWSVPASIPSWNNGGVFFVGSDPSSQTAWLTPAEWEATGIPTGDVYENVVLGSTYSVNADGFTAGSNLPTS